MCLERILKQTVPNQGRAWKVFYERPDGLLVTTMRRVTILPDVWLLNQEPAKCDQLHIDQGNLKEVCASSDSYGFGAVTISTPMPFHYEHGFHSWKKEPQDYDTWVCSLQLTYQVKSIQIFYRSYIAEDETQIVSRQIYVPVHTKGPEEGARIWEVNRKEYVIPNG